MAQLDRKRARDLVYSAQTEKTTNDMLMLTATAGRLYMCTLVSVVPCGRDVAVAEAAEQIRAEQCRSATSRPNKNIFKPAV